MQNVEKEGFAGLNSDDENRAMPKGDYRSATNIRNGSSDTGSVGSIENLKGNTHIEDNLPTGKYKTIGAYEDEVGNSIIYFLYNDDKIFIEGGTPIDGEEDPEKEVGGTFIPVLDAGIIMRFFIDSEEIVQVAKGDEFGFNNDSNIHSIDLIGSKLYWTDGETEPKKINIDKANNSAVPRKVNIYFPKAYEEYWDTHVYTGSIEITDVYNDSVYTVFIPEIGGVPTSLNSFSSQAANAINSQVEGENSIVANACGNFLQIEFLNPGDSDIEFLTGGFDFGVVPENFYKGFNSDVVNQIKASPACKPTFDLIAAGGRSANYINKKNFQFSVRYVFDDNEKTVLSPYSLISYAAETCGSSNENLNTIRIYYNDDRLLTPISLTVIKRVEICFRESNGGKWRLMEAIEQGDIGVREEDQFFDFYNDQAYTFLPEEESNLNFHEVPQKSETQEFVENRLYHGNVTSGFDEVCVEAEVDISYLDPIEIPDTFSVTGTIQILNKYKSNEYAQQVIWQESEGGAFKFGGIDGNSKLDTDVDYDQAIPLGGFVVYLAGTDFHSVTVQDVRLDATGIGAQNVYRAWDSGDRSDVENAIGDGDIFQRFEIKDVPPGKYIMRVASHKTTAEQLKASRAYQDTSTTVNHDPRSAVIWGTEKVIEVVASDVDFVDTTEGFSIVDLSNPEDFKSAKSLVGYLTEDVNVGVFDPSERPMELSRVSIEGRVLEAYVSGPITDLGGATLTATYTDHNGFFFITADTDLSSLGVNEEFTYSVANQLSLNIFSEIGTVSSGDPSGKYGLFYLKGSNPQLDVSSKVEITGYIGSSGDFGVKGVVVVPINAKWTESDGDGIYKVSLYGDTYLYDTSVLARRNPSALLIGRRCWFEFAPDISQEAIVGVGTSPGYFNVGNPYIHDDVAITSGEGVGGSAFKRGFDGQLGIIYRDNGSRVSQVFTVPNLQTHVNFYTELNKFGAQENYGAPALSWLIKHKAPEWATHYQWVRTKNESVLDYIQFAVNSVILYDENDDVTVTFNDAVKVEMDLSNIGSYEEQNPGSILALPNLDAEWRVRFIQDENGDYYDEYFDEPIVSSDAISGIEIAKNASLEIEPGVLIEVYRPQRLSDNKLYYEFGECYEVINGLHQGPSRSQTEWEFTDNQFNLGNLSFVGDQNHKFIVGEVVDIYQNYPYTNASYNGSATVIEVPTNTSIVLDKPFGTSSTPEGGTIVSRATGTFSGGDTYYRTRFMSINDNASKVTRPVDDASISDFYISENTDIGRLHVEDPLAKNIKDETLVMFSEAVLDSSRVNGLNEFKGPNSELLPVEYGPVRRLIKAGNVLISICELRTVSMYINERVITSAEGNDTLVATDAVIGNVRAMTDHFGTVNPESVHERAGTIVFWDGLKGSVIQVSSNGLFPISSYKMVKHFGDISKAFRESGVDMRVYGVHDQYFKDNIMVFGGVTDFIDPETIVYSNQIKRWISFRSYVPERVASTSMKLVTFSGGKLYLHNSNEVHNNFYGTQYTSKVNTVSNEDPKNIKSFRALSYESNLPWSAPLISIPANSQYPLGMISRLKVGKFINKEGIYYSEFLKDMNSPGFSTETEALIDGRDLRGKVIDITLESDNTSHTVLFSFNVKSTSSEMSNR